MLVLHLLVFYKVLMKYIKKQANPQTSYWDYQQRGKQEKTKQEWSSYLRFIGEFAFRVKAHPNHKGTYVQLILY